MNLFLKFTALVDVYQLYNRFLLIITSQNTPYIDYVSCTIRIRDATVFGLFVKGENVFTHPFDGQSVCFIVYIDFLHGFNGAHKRFAEILCVFLMRVGPCVSVIYYVRDVRI